LVTFQWTRFTTADAVLETGSKNKSERGFIYSSLSLSIAAIAVSYVYLAATVKCGEEKA